MTTDQL